ncbi:MAG: hypothetical protein K8F91_18895, partial [Candidatus Obscuribacterales bacterium]|nr:hypothetical protein [Candidatus Obscuribacterales bacterium]
LVIWLPSPAESREFRNKLMTGKIKPESDTSSGGTSGSKFASAEDELSARFGQQWDGTTNEGTSSPSPRDELIASSMAKADQRRKNIEAALGPIAPKKKKHADGKLRYVVRLGDSLKSIAMKHPAIKDVSLWKLIAEVNGLTTEVDQKGSPKATIARGSSILLPSYQEMAAHREKLGLTKAKLIGSNTKHGVDSEFASKKCPECSRLAVVRATICPCGHEFKETAGLNASKEKLPETTDSLKDAATIVLEAAGLIEKPGDKPPVKTIIDDQSKIPPVAQALNQHLIGAKTSMSDESGDTVFRTPEEHKDEPIIAKTWQVEHSLDEDVRLVKSAQSFAASEGALEVALEVKVEGIWSLMVNYQITDGKTYRHDHTSGTGRKSVKIDLPAKASEELAHNDLSINWKNYRKKFLKS